ncbi:MAG: DEAD/DEAH box helicase family protein, partial [Bacteroidota bacterium]|nr:DEAD/DEAH box helicase family protein [Bacteroidota bacterium]
MSNFSNVPAEWQSLAQTALEAEHEVNRAPLYAAMLCRKSLEEWVRWMYEHDEDLTLPYDTSLNALLNQQSFKQLIAPSFYPSLNLIRRLGNDAVHTDKKIDRVAVLHALKLLHGFIFWVINIYSEERVTKQPFDETIIPKGEKLDVSKAELRNLERAYLGAQEELQKAQEELASIKALKAVKLEQTPPPIDPDEALTRKLYIDCLLREAGWNPNGKNVPEYPVTGMPKGDGSEDGNGRVDYVLWGNDGLPLAVVEAKRTTRDAKVGQHQAFLYANCLQKEFGQRPVIFYTNGFESWIWDDLQYPPRPVFGFYTKSELQTLINRRTLRKPLSQIVINNDITDRHYQIEAIRAVSEILTQNHREALLVMATGTGKTRVSASIIDLLSKAGWVKRVLFLADRNALVHQAKTNLNTYLPNLPAVDLTKEKEDESSRIVFSTYQTIINMIDGEADGDNRFYGVGHFDLIIFDEIHRSVYNKYKHIFKYFDGFRIGLTATPKAEGDRDTYALFELEPHNPTFAYELNEAVTDKFLVPPKGMPASTKFQRKGIKYADLSDEEKLKYEEQFADPLTGEFPDEIEAQALNNWLFNTDTVDKVIGHLMENGLKVEGGDKLGKTIIFARSHDHAEFIKERFDKQYPHYNGHFLSLIDYKEEYKYDLLNKFKEKEKMPQIAVSVDMLDTGIDVPEVLNLVFFKPVRSSAKYWQMIGRGTRLCKDLFGEGIDKEEFVIFDLCENFEFFGDNPKGYEAKAGKSISQRLFEVRLRLAQLLIQDESPDHKEYAESLLQYLTHQTQALNGESFIIRQHWRYVEKYRDPNSWNALSDLDMKELYDHIAPLVVENDQDEMAKRFDALMLDIQLSCYMEDKRQINLIRKVVETAEQLSKKGSIPSVGCKMETIKKIQKEIYWENITIKGLEHVRTELRDLLKFLEKDKKKIVYTSYEDEIGDKSGEVTVLFPTEDLAVYRKKVNQYLHEHENHLTIHKIKTNIPVTKDELNELERMLFEQGE